MHTLTTELATLWRTWAIEIRMNAPQPVQPVVASEELGSKLSVFNTKNNSGSEYQKHQIADRFARPSN